MNKKVLLSLVMMALALLVGCQAGVATPAEPPSAAVAEVSTIGELAGLWWRPGAPAEGKYWWQINADGTLMVDAVPKTLEQHVAERLKNNPMDSGKLWFEGSTLHIQSGCSSADGTYTVEQAGNNQLKFVAIQDPCADRQAVITGVVWQKAS